MRGGPTQTPAGRVSSTRDPPQTVVARTRGHSAQHIPPRDSCLPTPAEYHVIEGCRVRKSVLWGFILFIFILYRELKFYVYM